MTERYEKLIALLKELFQLDQPDLDFGLYRIMHAKSAEVTQFLEKDLLPQVKAAFAQYQPAEKGAIEKELTKAIEQSRALGADPETLPKVKELRARLIGEAVDLNALEAEVYDQLYSFFRRYYSEGDFLSKRVYKPGVYAIPYEGEEVKLHWANADQYYIKTSEYLRDYAFRLRPDDKKNPLRVHFRLMDAAEGEHGNVKEVAGKERRFRLASATPVVVEDGELVIRFTYEPDPGKQKDLNTAAEQAILRIRDAALAEWVDALGRKHVRSDGTESEATRLRVHLDRYTARNTFDYFIHKDLGGFLRRELDFFIKNEVMHLDDIESETAPRVEQYLSKLRVIRAIAGKIIEFLAQLEDFQKKLWLKKKFVVETQYCITLDRLPEELYPEIAANDAQREEWVKLFSIDQVQGNQSAAGYSNPLTREFLQGHRTLVVDTRHFSSDFTARVVATIDGLDDHTSGIAVQSDNFHFLSLMSARFRERVQCAYIDPPFNTGDDFFFKDGYRFSSWLGLLENRLQLCHGLLTPSGSKFVHLDHNANFLGRLLLDSIFGPNNFVNEIIWRIGWVSGYKTQVDAFVRNHDTLFFYAKDASQHAFNKSRSRIPYQAFDRASIADELTSIMKKWGVDTKRVSNMKLSIKYPDGRVFKLGLAEKEAGYNIEDTWNCSEYEELNSNKIKRNAAEYTPHGSFLTQKPEELVKRIIELTTKEGDLVLDYFGGSGTTAAVAWKLGRQFLISELEGYFDDDILWRFKKVLNGHAVGISRSVGPKTSGLVKYMRLESYEDALNNLDLRRGDEQEGLLALPPAQGSDKLHEQYLLRYMLDVETRASQSLLNIAAFTDPTVYRLKIKRTGSDESREVNVDLLETFNWLIGLTVQRIAAPQTLSAGFERDTEKRLRLKDKLQQTADGRWWFRTVTGLTPDGRKTLVIWRKRPGGETPEGIEQDNLVLDEWFTQRGFAKMDSELDVIYVNGSNNLENLKAPSDTWTVRLIEDDFHRLMFETDGG